MIVTIKPKAQYHSIYFGAPIASPCSIISKSQISVSAAIITMNKKPSKRISFDMYDAEHIVDVIQEYSKVIGMDCYECNAIIKRFSASPE